MYLIVCEEEKIERDEEREEYVDPTVCEGKKIGRDEGREGTVGLIDYEGEKINSDERLRSCRQKEPVSSSI